MPTGRVLGCGRMVTLDRQESDRAAAWGWKAPQMTRSLYEQPCFRVATGSELRPGGLDLTAELVARCGLGTGDRVLDVGCGVGATASFLNRHCGAEAVGLDISERSLAEARARNKDVTWVLGRAQEIGYPDHYFDAVLCECFLSTLDDPVRVLREIGRVLRPRGVLGVTDLYLRSPKASRPFGAAPRGTCLRGATGREQTEQMFEDAGLGVEVWEDRSETLKSLMASLVFAYGSSADFWEAALGEGAPARAAVEACSPGYYLMVARPKAAH